jgi:phage terminase large subunit-like protein
MTMHTQQSQKSYLAMLGTLNDTTLKAFLQNLSDEALALLKSEFIFSAHPHQMMPLEMLHTNHYTDWLILGGRGSGKTRAGAEAVLQAVRTGQAKRIALVGETLHDVAEIMILGVSGIMNCALSHERPHFVRSERKLIFPNGAVAAIFSAKDPDSLRGPQFDFAWCDEFAKWSNPEAVRTMLAMGLRLGECPKQIITTTPRPLKILREIIDSPTTLVTNASTKVNSAYLSKQFIKVMEARYENTRIGRQELQGILFDDFEGSLWSRNLLDKQRVEIAPSQSERCRIVVAVDPPVSSHSGSDECGIIVACTDFNDPKKAYIIADLSGKGMTPAQWAKRVAEAYYTYNADRVVAEINQGGEMVRTVIETIDSMIPFKGVFARRGKISRAEPIAALYEKGIIYHAGHFPELEDQMCGFTVDHIYAKNTKSPDRVDALVWALTELMLMGEAGMPKIHLL